MTDYLTDAAAQAKLPSRLAAMLAAKQIADAIVAAVVEAGPLGAPGGVIYAALMTQGCSLEQYEAFMSALCKTGKLRKSGDLYFAIEQPKPVDGRDPDHSRDGCQERGTFFAYHNCYKCKDGLLPCATPNGNVCEYPHARDD